MVVRFTNAQFDDLVTSDAANEDIIGMMNQIIPDGPSWEIFQGLLQLSQARALHRIAGALQGLVIEADLKSKRDR